MNDNAQNDPRLAAIPDIHGHAKGEHKAFSDERPIPLSARMLFLWFYHACRRGSPRFLMVSDHMNYLTFEDPAAINLVRRALKLAQAGDLYGAAETASVEVGHAAVVSEGLRRGMRYSIGAEVDNDPRSRPDAQNIVDAMKPDGMIRSVHFLTIDHPTHGPNWNWPFDNPEFADVYELVGTAKLWDLYMATLLDAIERLPGNIVGHFYVPAFFGHWPDDATLEGYEDRLVDACEARGMAIELNTRFLYREHSDEEKEKYLAAYRRLLPKCKAKNVGIAVGSDAHSPKDQGGGFATVLGLLDECAINELVFPISGRLARVALRVERKVEAVPEAPAPALEERKAARRLRLVEPPVKEEPLPIASENGDVPKVKPARPKRSKVKAAETIETSAADGDGSSVGVHDGEAPAHSQPAAIELAAAEPAPNAAAHAFDETSDAAPAELETMAGATEPETPAATIQPEPQPAAAETEPPAAETEFQAAETEPAAAETEPAAAETEPSTAEMESQAAETEPATAEMESQAAETEPATAEMESAGDVLEPEEPVAALESEEPNAALELGEPAGALELGEPAGALELEEPAGALDLEEPAGALELEEPAGALELEEPAGALELEEPAGALEPEEPAGAVEAEPAVAIVVQVQPAEVVETTTAAELEAQETVAGAEADPGDDVASRADAATETEPTIEVALEYVEVEVVDASEILVSAPLEEMVTDVEFEPIVDEPPEETADVEAGESSAETSESWPDENEENVIVVVTESLSDITVDDLGAVRKPRPKSGAKTKAPGARKSGTKPKTAVNKAAKPAVKSAAKKAPPKAAAKKAAAKTGTAKAAAKKTVVKKATPAPKKATAKKATVRSNGTKKVGAKKAVAKKATAKKPAQRRR